MIAAPAKLTLLGTGTSSGVPVIGCDCATCRSDDPRDRRLRCGALLEFTCDAGERRAVLLDVPPDHREQSLRLGLVRCDGILLTHAHVDHVFGLDEVRRYNAIMRRPIPVFGDEPTWEQLERVYSHILFRERNVNASFVADLAPHRVRHGDAIDLHGLRATAFTLWHGKLPILGWRIDGPAGDPLFPLAYCTDVNRIPDESRPFLQGLRTLLLDMLRPRPHDTHFTCEQAVAAAAEIAAERTVFVHMTHDIRHAELDPTLPPGMRLGFDGMALP